MSTGIPRIESHLTNPASRSHNYEELISFFEAHTHDSSSPGVPPGSVDTSTRVLKSLFSGERLIWSRTGCYLKKRGQNSKVML